MNATSPSYRATGLSGCTSLALCTVVLSVWITSASAETILIDDFSDGNDAGWTRIDSNAGQAWGPGTFDASSGAYQLGTTGEVPVVRRAAASSVRFGTSPPTRCSLTAL